MNDIRDRLIALVPNLGMLAVVLAIGVSLLGPFNSKPGAKTSADTGKSGAGVSPPPPSTAPNDKELQPHLRFLREINLYPSADEIRNAAEQEEVRQTVGPQLSTDPMPEFKSYRERCEYLIVTVPDPVDTQFGFWFDQLVESVQRAMSDIGYTLEHHWYPWRPAAKPAAPASRDPLTLPDHAKCPGVLVFHQNNEWVHKRVALLVGESPVNGIHPRALQAAFKLVEQLDGGVSPAEGRPSRPVRVNGPFFTGSQPSLVQGVQEWTAGKKEQLWVKAVSGAATGLKKPEEMDRLTGEMKHPPWLVYPLPRRVYQQETMRVSSSAVRTAILHYLAQPGKTNPTDALIDRPDGVAFLVESNTGFGDGVVEQLKSKNTTPVLRFPLHISRLTGIQSKDRRERDERLGLDPPGGSKLLALDAERSGADSLPAADEARTALLNQTSLADIWAVLRREQIRYLGVIATDPRDKLFLIEQLREHCPNVQPFVSGHDLHYSHPEYAAIMHGTLVAGTYPLYPPAQRWCQSPGDPRRHVFSSAHAEGVYNATLSLFDQDDKLLDHRPPGWGQQGSGHPPIWVSVIAEDGELVPLAYFTEYADPLIHRQANHPPLASVVSTAAPIPSLPASYTPGASLVVFVGSVGLFLAALYAIYLLHKYPWRTWCRRPNARRRLVVARTWVVVGLSTWSVSLGVWLYGVLLHAWCGACDENGFGILFLSVALVAAFAVGCLYLFFGCRMHRSAVWKLRQTLGVWEKFRSMCVSISNRQSWVWSARRTNGTPKLHEKRKPHFKVFVDPWTLVVVALTSAVAVVLLGVIAGWHLFATSPQHILFVERAGWVAKGSSVLVPALLLAAGLFGYGVSRLSAAGERAKAPADFPYPDVGPVDRDTTFREQFTHIWDEAIAFDRSVFDLGHLIFRRWRVTVPLAVAAVVVAILLGLYGRKAWEGPAWDWLFAVGLTALGFIAVRSALRMSAAWHSLEKILRTVARIPMVGAFDRLPDKVARMLADYLVIPHRSTSDLAISNHLLRLLRQALERHEPVRPDFAALTSGAPPTPPANDHLEQVRAVLPPRLSLWADPANPDERDELPSERQNGMAEISRKLVGKLLGSWQKAPVLQAFGQRPEEKRKDADFESNAGWRPIAEQFVAIQVVCYLAQFFHRLRHLATVAIIATACLLLAVTEFPFQPERLIVGTAVAVAVAVAVVILGVLFAINRNELISRVTQTAPDKFTLDARFLANVFTFVVPLVALVVVQLSGRLRWLFEPILELFR